MRHALAALMVLAVASVARGQYTVFPSTLPNGVARNNMMYSSLNNQIVQAHTTWQSTFDSLNTAEEIAAYQARQRGIIHDALGNFAGFPSASGLDLHAQVTGTVYRDGYKIEKVLFQSVPGFYVTGNLYVPTAPQYAGKSLPGVLMTTGHSDGKYSPTYGPMCALMALNGMVAFMCDPIDQGERHQQTNAWGTQSHTDAAVSNNLVGRNTATWMMWDDLRSIDYLLSRSEVDADKIGVTGSSGGGTQATYVMAIDDRIKAAVPNSWITTWKAVATDLNAYPTGGYILGPQDAEQNLYGVLGKGFEQADFVIARAPTLAVQVSANTDDFFPFCGTQETYDNAKALYTKLGAADKVEMATHTGNSHGYWPTLRAAGCKFLLKNLVDGWSEGDYVPEPASLTASTGNTNITAAESRVTATGQVRDLPGYKSTYQLNQEYELNTLQAQRTQFWAGNPLSATLAKVREMASIRPLGELPAATASDHGAISRTGYQIQLKALTVGDGIYLPGLLFVPTGTPTGAVLYVNDSGKSAEAAIGGRLEQLAQSGKVVFAVDVAGIGETKQTSWDRWAEIGTDFQDVTRAYLLGESYVGLRAENVLESARWLIGLGQAQGIETVDLLSVGNATGIAALHAAALERQLFDECTFENNLSSWASLVDAPSGTSAPYNLQYQNVVNGALTYYDLPDLLNVVETTPEPAGLALLATGAAAALRRRKP